MTTPSSVTYTLYGGVWEETSDGPAPIEGARVRDESGREAVTDAKGQFSISGLSPQNHTIWVTRSGYNTETKTFTMTSDRQLDIYVGRIQNYVLSGVVFEITEAGRIPIDGVELYCDSCGSPDRHTFVNYQRGRLLPPGVDGKRRPSSVRDERPVTRSFDPAGTRRDRHRQDQCYGPRRYHVRRATRSAMNGSPRCRFSTSVAA